MPIKYQDATWRALARETGMAGRLIGSGLTALRRADSSMPAVYYEGFFGLTIGLERTCKLAIVVSDFAQHGKFPSDGELKHKYGHDLASLIAEVRSRIASGELSTDWALPEELESADLIAFLTRFAKFNRYYNLSFLSTGSSSDAEPIQEWVDLVLTHHPQRALKPSDERNLRMAKEIDSRIGDSVLIVQLDDHGKGIDSFATSAAHGITTEHVRREGTMMCARLARSLASALSSLSHVRTASGDVLPVFTEFFGILFVGDDYLRGRKTFNYPR